MNDGTTRFLPSKKFPHTILGCIFFVGSWSWVVSLSGKRASERIGGNGICIWVQDLTHASRFLGLRSWGLVGQSTTSHRSIVLYFSVLSTCLIEIEEDGRER